MEGSLNGADSATTAVVVRRFVSSRIERQLLAQVFELVCEQRSQTEATDSLGQNGHATSRLDRGLQAVSVGIAGRPTA